VIHQTLVIDYSSLSLAGSCRDTAGGTAKRHQAKTKKERKSRHTHNHRSLMIYSFVLFFFSPSIHPADYIPLKKEEVYKAWHTLRT
jgi:hypothetical protein